jgi:hypothetical protein
VIEVKYKISLLKSELQTVYLCSFQDDHLLYLINYSLILFHAKDSQLHDRLQNSMVVVSYFRVITSMIPK